MPTLKLTQAAVDRLKTAGERPSRSIGTAQLPGFGLRPLPGNRRSEDMAGLLPGRGRMVREKLGTLAQIPNVADARELARQSMTKSRTGENPVEDRRRKEEEERRRSEAEEVRRKSTLAAVVDRYLVERPADRSRKPMRAEYLAETTRTLDKNVKQSALGKRTLDEITGDDIKRLVRGIAKDAPSQANHTLAYLKAMLAWAVDEGLIEKSPAQGSRCQRKR